MSSDSQAARNLLFGILAFQNNFIDRAQLMAAFDGWVLDRSKSLEEILAARAAINDDERKLLSALVARHLSKHDGTPSAPSRRSTWVFARRS